MGKRKLGFWEIWNLSFGYFGIQMGFALQNANASRILQTFGADVHQLSWFWIVAPLMGLIVQPIIGHYSDNTWGRFGRRKPYFLIGAVLASIGLILMPQAGAFTALMPALWMGAGFLMIMDASFNIAMEPMRAFVADALPSDQRTLGFSVQTILIGLGAVLGSWLPYILSNWIGIESTAAEGQIPLHLILSFVIGALVILITVSITVFTTKEYSPEELDAFDRAEGKEVMENDSNFFQIFKDFGNMPKTMKQLGLVQFFTWFALFGMWVYATPAIAHHVYKLPLNDTSSATFNEAADWVGIIFGVYNGISAIFAFFLPAIAFKIGRKMTHSVSLIIGGLGLISIYFIDNPNLLIVSMVGVGIAWASILAMPYAMLAGAIPARKMGVYMGIFNFFICMPQIVNAIFGGPIVKYFYGGNPIFAIVTSGIALIVAALCVIRVDDVDDPVKA